MAKKAVNKIEAMGPAELDELKNCVQEYITRREELEGQIAGIREDLKTLKQVVKILKIESEIAHKDAAETFKEALQDPEQ